VTGDTMKQVPLFLLFLTALTLCVGSFVTATYLEFFRDPPLQKAHTGASPTLGLMGLGFLSAIASAALAAVIYEENS
jgi:hypothetical protein